jgi:hypothetical protein
MQCEDCLFYQKETIELGVCRHSPPRLIESIVREFASGANSNLSDENLNVATRWPVVFCEDWCGKFEARNLAEP